MSKYHRSQTARDMGGDENSILVNINSTLFNLNSLIKLAQNRFNAEFIVEQGGIEAIAQIMVYHSANPTIMKAVRGIFNNIVEFNPTNSGTLDLINALISSPKVGTFKNGIFNSVLKLGVKHDGWNVLISTLKQNANNPHLCFIIIQHMNGLMCADQSIKKEWIGTDIYQPISNVMKAHPQHPQLIWEGTKALKSLKAIETVLERIKFVHDTKVVEAHDEIIILLCMKFLLTCSSFMMKELANKDAAFLVVETLHKMSGKKVIIIHALKVISSFIIHTRTTERLLDLNMLNLLKIVSSSHPTVAEIQKLCDEISTKLKNYGVNQKQPVDDTKEANSNDLGAYCDERVTNILKNLPLNHEPCPDTTDIRIMKNGEKGNEMSECDASIQNIFTKMREIVTIDDNELNQILSDLSDYDDDANEEINALNQKLNELENALENNNKENENEADDENENENENEADDVCATEADDVENENENANGADEENVENDFDLSIFSCNEEECLESTLESTSSSDELTEISYTHSYTYSYSYSSSGSGEIDITSLGCGSCGKLTSWEDYLEDKFRQMVDDEYFTSSMSEPEPALGPYENTTISSNVVMGLLALSSDDEQ